MKIISMCIFILVSLIMTCVDSIEPTPLTEDKVDMSTIDLLRDRPGAKYVDLRNMSDKYSSGYVDGFEILSFFEYLDNNAFQRKDGWNFSEGDLVNPLVLENQFGEKDREIFLMCGSGTRAGYVKTALESIGYTQVFNAGGIRDYDGDYKILGDENF